MPEKGWTTIVVRNQMKADLKARAEAENCSIGELIERGIVALDEKGKAGRAQRTKTATESSQRHDTEQILLAAADKELPVKVAIRKSQVNNFSRVFEVHVPAAAPKMEEPPKPSKLTSQPEAPATSQAQEPPSQHSLTELEQEIDSKFGTGRVISMAEMEWKITSDPNTPEDVKRTLLRQLYRKHGVSFH